jgi:protease-4
MWLAIAVVASGPASRLMADDASGIADKADKAATEQQEADKAAADKAQKAEKAEAAEKEEAAEAEKKADEAKKEAEAAADKAKKEAKDAADEAKAKAKAEAADSKAKAKAEKAKEEKKPADKEADDDSEKSAKKDSKPSSKKVRLAHIVIEGELPESPGEMSLFGDLGVDLRKTMARLEKAGEDKTVAGVILKIDAYPGRGKLNELRDSIKRVQGKGKKVYALMETANGPQYQLATACDEIVMPESGEVMLPGVRAEFAFYKDLLAKIGIEADMLHVGDYKGAAEPYTRDSLSEPVRKNMTELIDDMYDEMLAMIANDRDLKVEEVRKAVDRGLLMAKEAKEAGLIDRVMYPDEFRAELEDDYKSDKLVYVENYAKKKVDTDFSGPMGIMKLFQTMLGDGGADPSDDQAKVAVVYAVGPIMSGESASSAFGGSTMGSDTIVEALKDAADDDSVKAIVLRVDSPGGSALASDLIWRQTQAIDKPIVASMGDIAASGGYYISMGADRIFAEPGTVTGSIGVVGGKMTMKGLFDKLGIATESIARGDNSGMFSTTSKFSKSEREVVEKMMKDIYQQFTSKAAKGRKMNQEDLEKFAGGQVFTGRVAKRHGLVDEIGTLRDAIQSAKRLAGIDADEKVEIKVLPEPKNPFEALFGADMDAEKEAQAQLLSGLATFAPELRGVLVHAMQLRQVMREPVALMMPYWFEVK